MQFSGGWKKDKKERERVGKHWIGAEKPVKVYSRSARRRFLTRVLIQIGGDGLGLSRNLDFNLRPFFLKPVRKIVDIEKAWCIGCTDR